MFFKGINSLKCVIPYLWDVDAVRQPCQKVVSQFYGIKVSALSYSQTDQFKLYFLGKRVTGIIPHYF